MEKNHGPKSGGLWKKTVLITICVVLSVILVISVAAVGIMSHMLGKINRADEDDHYTISQDEALKMEQEQLQEEAGGQTPEAESNPQVEEENIVWDDDPEQIVGDSDHLINILLIGQDRRPGEGRTRSDAMILCTVNKETKTLTLTSFLRDLYVQIPGYQDTRLNAAYAYGGMPLLDEALSVNFGVHVDANVEVDFTGFQSVIDALGGVGIWLTESEANYLNAGSPEWGLVAGTNWLSGEQALAYSRIRYLDSDFGRTNRQRTVLVSLVESVRGTSLSHLLDLVNTVLPMITTDMSDTEIIGYAMELFPLLQDLEIVTQHVPVDDGYQSVTIRGMQVLLPDLTVNRQMLQDTLS